MRFSKHTIILRKENRVVLVNKCTRNWYRLSEELFSVIKFAVDKNLADDELLQNLYDEEDRKCKFCSNGTPILKSAVHSF